MGLCQLRCEPWTSALQLLNALLSGDELPDDPEEAPDRGDPLVELVERPLNRAEMEERDRMMDMADNDLDLDQLPPDPEDDQDEFLAEELATDADRIGFFAPACSRFQNFKKFSIPRACGRRW